jgi:hypothetical protein
MKSGLFGFRPFDLMPYCGQRAIIADHSRKQVIAVDPGVEFDAFFTHPSRLARTLPFSQRQLVGSSVPPQWAFENRRLVVERGQRRRLDSPPRTPILSMGGPTEPVL